VQSELFVAQLDLLLEMIVIGCFRSLLLVT
jgi:hypothetical protein